MPNLSLTSLARNDNYKLNLKTESDLRGAEFVNQSFNVMLFVTKVSFGFIFAYIFICHLTSRI